MRLSDLPALLDGVPELTDVSHADHRRHLRARFHREGLASFTDEQALELMLFYAIPRMDVSPMAKRLLARFGTFAGVLEARADELMQVEGVGQATADYLRLLLPVFRRYELSRRAQPSALTDREALLGYLVQAFMGERDETILILCLDGHRKLLYEERIALGTPQTAGVDLRRVAALALRTGASGIVIAHNHPCGAPEPSDEDRRFSEELRRLLTMLGVTLIDHLVFIGGRAISALSPR